MPRRAPTPRTVRGPNYVRAAAIGTEVLAIGALGLATLSDQAAAAVKQSPFGGLLTEQRLQCGRDYLAVSSHCDADIAVAIAFGFNRG